jgi:MFS family permease
MARNQFVASLVGILGPITAGAFAEGDPRRAAWIVLCLGLTGGIGAALLTGLPVFDPPEKPEEGRVWRRPGVALSSIGSLASGAWYVATNTFVPVVLGNANWSNSAMGTVMGATNAAMLIGVLAAGQAKPARFGNIIVLGTVVSALGVGLLSVAGSIPGLTVVAFITSGVGTGALMTLCPTLAAQSVQPEERSQAVVTTGVYRSGALLGTPILVSVATLFMPVGAVMIVVAGLTGLPGVGAAIARAARPGT